MGIVDQTVARVNGLTGRSASKSLALLVALLVVLKSLNRRRRRRNLGPSAPQASGYFPLGIYPPCPPCPSPVQTH
ncbi:hypothetical protein IMZ48_17400 [Candidatus Bathyarchaeota archaeon]|nr:hypothetical protein [Candidatus Bathyarchaeota archaeon]